MNCDVSLLLLHRKLFLPSDSCIHDLTHMRYEHGLIGADLPTGKLLYLISSAHFYESILSKNTYWKNKNTKVKISIKISRVSKSRAW